MTAPLQVDVTGWLITRLSAVLTAKVDGETPADLAAEVPFVRVRRVGGTNDNIIIDKATVAFDCFDVTQQAANQLGYTVLNAVRGLRGLPGSGAILTRANTLSGPSWAPTENVNLHHAVVLMQTLIKTTG
jgi:hypothetical protein